MRSWDLKDAGLDDEQCWFLAVREETETYADWVLHFFESGKELGWRDPMPCICRGCFCYDAWLKVSVSNLLRSSKKNRNWELHSFGLQLGDQAILAREVATKFAFRWMKYAFHSRNPLKVLKAEWTKLNEFQLMVLMFRSLEMIWFALLLTNFFFSL